MRRPKRSTTDVYEIRPRADKHNVNLVGGALPYGPMWYRGRKAITDAIDLSRHYTHGSVDLSASDPAARARHSAVRRSTTLPRIRG